MRRDVNGREGFEKGNTPMCKARTSEKGEGSGVRRRSVHLAVLGAGMLVLAHGCNAESKRVLIISPSSLVTGAASGTQTLEVRKKGAGSLPFTISVDYGPGPSGWLVLSQTSGSATNQPQFIDVTDQRDGLPPGHHTATIRFETDRGKKNIPASVDVAAVATSVNYHDFGSSPTPFTLGVWNSGAGVLNFEVVSQPSWLVVSNGTGISTGPGTASQVILSVSAGSLPPQTYGGSLVIGPGGGGGTNSGTVDVVFTVPPTSPPPPAPAALTVLPSQGFTSSGPEGGPFLPVGQTYVLMNTGGSTLQWSAAATASWLTLSSLSGSLAPSASTPVVVGIGPAANSLPVANHTGQVNFTNLTNGAGSALRTVVLGVTGSTGPPATAILVPGNGFSGPTAQPPNVGNSGQQGYTAWAIARWDTVPYQTVEQDMGVGVVAFHRKGIDRVEFSVNGGPWVPVSEMTLNPDSGVYEYWALLRPSDFSAAGTAEVRAIAYPTVGKPRVLSGMFLTVDATASLPKPGPFWASPSGNDSNPGTQGQPVKTIWKAVTLLNASPGGAGGGTIYLQPGTYDAGGAQFEIQNERWYTIRPAPGVSPASCILGSYSGNGLWSRRLKLENLRVATRLKGGDGAGDYAFWLDQCDQVGPGQEATLAPYGGSWFFYSGGIFLTNGLLRENNTGPLGSNLIRNMQISQIGEDVFKTFDLIVNSTVDDVDSGSQSSWHPDLFNVYGVGNRIAYNVKCTNIDAQGIYPEQSIEDVAFVNVVIQGLGWGVSQNDGVALKHFLLWNCTLDQNFLWRASCLENLSVRGNSFSSMSMTTPNSISSGCWSSAGPTVQGVLAAGDFMDNHFVGTNSLVLGSAPTTGTAGYANPGAGNYTPLPNSPLKNRVLPLLVPVDLANNPRDPLAGGSSGSIE